MHSLLAAVRQEYPKIATRLLGPLLETLSVSREHCGGDADKFLVLLVVAIRTTQHPDFGRYTQEQLLSGEVEVFPSLGTNVRSIAASLGIPKETVRRKVRELIDAGWFVRRGNRLFFTSLAYQALAPVREAIERTAVKYFAVVSDLAETDESGVAERERGASVSTLG